ncbi:MAG: hypothetical protein GC203_09920 [Phenylobacterium sp.]|uniref:hypothetical protein n=1 Tax=Phenylobacterium sp. TaxID=1871053 RepID=UPI0025EBC73A|nr:hypothetical protein [Phenylobacterium sp.]MBI1198167.1 hypothetical protein [Phenylobacterium sp.]
MTIDAQAALQSINAFMDNWWVALVTFERSDAEQAVLPEWAQGACGWMACRASSEESVRDLLAQDLRHCGLKLLAIDSLQGAVDEGDADEIDEHLAANMRQLEAGKLSVWGTIHCYKADGEA